MSLCLYSSSGLCLIANFMSLVFSEGSACQEREGGSLMYNQETLTRQKALRNVHNCVALLILCFCD